LEEKQMRYGLKITFLVHVIVAAIFGLLFLLIPDVFANLTGLPAQEPAMSTVRVLGAAMLALAASSWLAYRETLWGKVKIVVQMEIVWTILGALTSVWGLVSGAFPVALWMNVIILGAFAVAFIAFYTRK
jgi:hypothetical protein